MDRHFKVAGHVFGISIPADNPVWKKMGQYKPFLVGKEEKDLFTLEVSSEHLSAESAILHSSGQDNENEQRIDLYELPEGGWLVEMAPFRNDPVCARLFYPESGRIMLEILDPALDLFSLNNALMISFAFATISLDTLMMHASVVTRKGRAYLFLAPSGTGKSTHSSLWLKNIAGTSLLNDDNPAVRITDGKTIVYGTPWSGKTACYKNESAIAGAFVQIKRNSFNKATPLSPVHSYAMLLSSSSGIKTDRKMGQGLYNTISRIIGEVPCFELDCLPDDEAALVCHSAVCPDEQ